MREIANVHHVELEPLGLASSPVEPAVDQQPSLLRAVTTSRLLDYGVSPGEANSIRGAVAQGNAWDATALACADRRRINAARARSAGLPYFASRELVASAILAAVAQLSVDRAQDKAVIYRRVVADYAEAAELAALRCERMIIEQGQAVLVCWLLLPPGQRKASTVLIWGGTSGWGPVYHRMARALLEMGIAVGLVELPGQGEPLLLHRSCLTDDFTPIVGHLLDRLSEHRQCAPPFGVLGHSFGGSLAALAAQREPRISACAINGGFLDPIALARRHWRQRQLWRAMFGIDEAQLESRLSAFAFDTSQPYKSTAVLVLHGQNDPLVTADDAAAFALAGTARDVTLVEFPGGEHCLYNVADQRDALIAAWFASHLHTAA